ncbi:MAG: hypothetical protein EOM37_06985 [Proteobacteria bacterium]|jgi:hypothetical protein|nr:hypothetical protein [Alphaproteobacteria bacterium]NCC03773.1 hypothetical protein [Pseudomonadota bacterium]
MTALKVKSTRSMMWGFNPVTSEKKFDTNHLEIAVIGQNKTVLIMSNVGSMLANHDLRHYTIKADRKQGLVEAIVKSGLPIEEYTDIDGNKVLVAKEHIKERKGNQLVTYSGNVTPRLRELSKRLTSFGSRHMKNILGG